jgi:hypothetical protein
MIHPVKGDIKLFSRSEESCGLNSFLQPAIVFTPKKIFRWDMTKED